MGWRAERTASRWVCIIAIASSRTQKAKRRIAQHTRGVEPQLQANRFNPRHVPLLSICVSISIPGDQTVFDMRKLLICTSQLASSHKSVHDLAEVACRASVDGT